MSRGGGSRDLSPANLAKFKEESEEEDDGDFNVFMNQDKKEEKLEE